MSSSWFVCCFRLFLFFVFEEAAQLADKIGDVRIAALLKGEEVPPIN